MRQGRVGQSGGDQDHRRSGQGGLQPGVGKGPVHMDSRQWRISLSKLAEAWVIEAGGVTRVES